MYMPGFKAHISLHWW